MTTVAYFGCPFCGRSQEINYALNVKGDYMKIGSPLDLGTIQMRQAMGSRGFKTISEEPAINLISDPQVLQILNAMVDMAGGILWGCWEQEMFTKLHPPVLIHKYGSLLNEIRENKLTEESLKLQIADLQIDNAKLIKKVRMETEDDERLQTADIQMENRHLIEKLHKETEYRETLACENADAEEKIRQMQMKIDQYESQAIDI